MPFVDFSVLFTVSAVQSVGDVVVVLVLVEVVLVTAVSTVRRRRGGLAEEPQVSIVEFLWVLEYRGLSLGLRREAHRDGSGETASEDLSTTRLNRARVFRRGPGGDTDPSHSSPLSGQERGGLKSCDARS